MCQFICYNQFSSLHNFNSQDPQKTITKQFLKQKLFFNKKQTHTFKDQIILDDSLRGKYYFLTLIQINYETKIIKCTSSILINNYFLKGTGKIYSNIIMRNLNRINEKNRNGLMCMSENGQIKIRRYYNMSESEFMAQTSSVERREKMINNLRQGVVKEYSGCCVYLLKLLNVNGLIEKKVQQSCRQVQDLINNCENKYRFMVTIQKDKQNIKQNQQLKLKNPYIIKQFQRYLNYTKYIYPNQNNKIYNQIQIINQPTWKIVQNTSQYSIYKTKLSFTTQNKQPIHKLILKKKFKSNLPKNYIQLLQTSQHFDFVNIIKHYISKNTKHNQILQQYMTFGTIHNYLKLNQKTCSIYTKIYFICQFIQGIRSLDEAGILNIDLTSNKISVGKGLILRISNLQSCHIKKDQRQLAENLKKNKIIKDGEYLNKESQSLGFLIEDLIFLEKNKNEQNDQVTYYEKLQNLQQQKKRLCPQRLRQIGPYRFMMNLYRIQQKCLMKNKNKPQLKWMQIIFRRLLQILECGV